MTTLSLDRDADEGEPFVELPEDRFYHGVIYKIFRGKQGGVVRASSGRKIPFNFQHVTMLGDVRKFEQLREGMRVGFDMGWTSRGLRVTVLRPHADRPRTDS